MTPEQAAEIANYRATHNVDPNPDSPLLAPFECVWVDVVQTHDETCYFWPDCEMFGPPDALTWAFREQAAVSVGVSRLRLHGRKGTDYYERTLTKTVT